MSDNRYEPVSEETAFLKALEERAIQHPLIFDTDWWPDYVAVAWILERDRAYTEDTARCRSEMLPPRIVIADDTHEAWEQLRRIVADGAEAEGVPFKRIGGVETNEPKRRISADEFASLKYHSDAEIGPCLVPLSWKRACASERQHDLQGLKSIKIWRDAVLARFPEGVLTSDLVGPPINPNSTPYMPFFEAAYWIATKGGRLIIDVRDKRVWKGSIVDELVPLIASCKTEAIGLPAVGGLPRKIEAYLFANIRVSYPYQIDFEDFVFGDAPYIECYGRVDEESWHKGTNDKLFSRWRVLEWDHLQIASEGLPRYQPGEWRTDRQGQTVVDIVTNGAATKGKPGARPKWDWDDIELFVCKKLDTHGDFSDPKFAVQGWQSFSDLYSHVRRYVEGLVSGGPGSAPSDSTLKKRIPPMVNKWRAKIRLVGN
jgi:hypothetical protein